MKTDEQLEKQISGEFEKYWSSTFEGMSDGDFIKYRNLGRSNAKEAFKAAALPLMKKIEEHEKHIKFHHDLRFRELNETSELNAKLRELQKENEDRKDEMIRLNQLVATHANDFLKEHANTEKLQKENEELRKIVLDLAHLHDVLDGNMKSARSETNAMVIHARAIKEIRTRFNLDKEGI